MATCVVVMVVRTSAMVACISAMVVRTSAIVRTSQTAAMYTVWSVVDGVMIARTSIETAWVVVAAVETTIGIVDPWNSVIVVVRIGVVIVDAEQPAACRGIDWTAEVVERHEAQILIAGHDVSQVFVTIVQEIIVMIGHHGITIDHIIHDGVDRCDEIVVDLIAVFDLLRSEIELIRHAISEETCFLLY